MILTTISFIVIFTLLVMIHEWGHFAAARKAGIKVEEFGLGLPPRAKSLHKDKKGTIYSINWIPFGGFVRLFGEDSSDPKVLKDKKSFASKTLWQRTTVILAGVFMNFILAWVLISIGFMIGTKPFLATQADVERGIESGVITAEKVVYVNEVLPDSPALKAQIKAGDQILSIDNSPITNPYSVSEKINPSTSYELMIRRGGEKMGIKIKSNEAGKIGVSLSQQKNIIEIGKVKYPILMAPIEAGKEVFRLSYLTVAMLGDVVSQLTNQLSVPDGVAGPVGIFKMTGEYAKDGFSALMQFTALLSISLAVINVMPFPALDGGRFLFIIFEVIARKKPNAKWEAIIHSIGFILLMILILIITWNDIQNLILS